MNKIFLILSLILIAACSNQNEPEGIKYAYCYKVIDGDSYRFIYDNDSIEVRHLYIDCYETYPSDRLKKQADRNHISVDSALALGFKAKEFVRELIEGENVILERDLKENDKDVYNRYLRVVIFRGQRLDSLLLDRNLAFEYSPF